jgi:hypothetical protein
MKKNLGFFVSLLLLAVVSGAVGYLMWKDEQAPPEAPPSELRVFPDDLKGLAKGSLTRAGEPPIVLLQTKAAPSPDAGIGEWRIEAPQPYRADIMAIGEWIGTLRTLEAERLLDATPGSDEGFGLDAPMLTIELDFGGGSKVLKVGAMNPTGSARYASLSGASKLYLLGTGAIATLNKSLGDLRQKRAMDTTEFAVDSLRMEAPGRTWELVRTPTRDWTFGAAAGFRADQTLMGEFVSTVIGARTEAAALAQPSIPEARFRAMAPVAAVSAKLADGTRAAEFRRDKDNTLYARSEDLSGIYPVQSDLESYLKKTLEEFRNKRLFDFGFADVFTLRFEAGGRALNLTKPNEQWQLEGKGTDSAKANKLLDELRAATATLWVDGPVPGTVVAKVQLETAGGSKEEVEFRRDGTECFAVRAGESGYYKLPESVLKGIETAATEIPSGKGQQGQ